MFHDTGWFKVTAASYNLDMVWLQCTYPPVNEHVPGDFTTLISTLSHQVRGGFNMNNPKLGRRFNLLRSFFTWFSLHLLLSQQQQQQQNHVEIFIQKCPSLDYSICPPCRILPPRIFVSKRPPVQASRLHKTQIHHSFLPNITSPPSISSLTMLCQSIACEAFRGADAAEKNHGWLGIRW